MRLIFEQDIEQSDFIEVILTHDEVVSLMERPKGIVKDFPKGLFGIRNLNVYIRKEHAIS